MPQKRLSKRSLAASGLAAVLCGGLTGCPDPEKRYDEFLENSAEERAKGDLDFSIPDMSDVPFDPATMSGTYMLSLAVELDPTKPLVFKADIAVAGEGEARTIALTLTPLRSWCGEARCQEDDPTFREELPPVIPSPGPVPLSDDGSFEVDFGDITAPGGANNISGAEIVVNLKLFGQKANDGTPCGQISGALSSPFPFDLKRDTNNFGMVRSDGPYNTISPISRCF